MNAQLYFTQICVGEIEDIIVHQGTWFGLFKQTHISPETDVTRRLCEFIEFCKKWHEAEDADATDFDQFDDVLCPRSWRVCFSDGTEHEMTDGPIFFGNEISWLVPLPEPLFESFREEAVAQEWSRLRRSVM